MPRPVALAVSLALVLPARALAAFDPNLHVNPALDDCSVQFSPSLTQGAYRRFVREFGATSAFKPGAAPRSLGQWGVSVGVEYISFAVEEKAAAWNDTFAHPDSTHELGSQLAFPKLVVRAGVTDRLDVGAFYTKNLAANYGWLGVEGRYAVLDERDDRPVTLSVRGAYTKTLHVADMDMHAVSADVSAGRTFWRHVTPYLGVGADAVLARERSPAVELATETVLVPHATAGVEVRFWKLAVGAEAQLSALTSYQLQLSAVF